MTDHQLFALSNTVILPFWLLYVFAPRWRWTQWLAARHIGPALLAIVYGVLIGPMIGTLLVPEAPNLDKLMGMFSTRLMVILWLHLLALDLLAGEWMTLDALARRMPHWLSGICKYLTLMMGPLGVMVYLLVRNRWAPAGRDVVAATSAAAV